MILSIGTDIVNKQRVAKIFANFTSRFAAKVLSAQELIILSKLKLNEQKIAYIAKRFAAKEAISKAIGVGIGALGMKNLNILNNNVGKPYVLMNFDIVKYFPTLENITIDISLSDEKEYALAFAVIHST